MSEHVRFFGVTRRDTLGQQRPAPHAGADTRAVHSSPDGLASSRHQVNFPRVVSGGFSSELATTSSDDKGRSWVASRSPSLGARNETVSSRDREFAALCFSFGTLVGLPLFIFSFVCGLLISFD